MQPSLPDDTSHGLVVYRASRLEALLDPLLALLDGAPPAQVLAPQTVIAAHPGMRHWLAAALARRRGPEGIVANLRITLPSSWLDELAQARLGADKAPTAPYRRDRLRWRIHEQLPGIDDAQVQAYLAGGDPLRRYQLADRLAQLYGQYLVYRPDWLLAWQRGESAIPDAGFLAPLWRALRQGIGAPHRGELAQRLLRDLARPNVDEAEPVHLFGISHLAPIELGLLRAVAQVRPVMLYVPDPCREYWAGLRGERAQLRELARRTGFDAESEQYFLDEVGHPLLAAWGRMGQHFMLGLHDVDEAIRMDVRHWQDEAPAWRDGRGLLQRLQESIRQFEPALVEPLAGGEAAALADRSLRVHLCHTRLRELEVLRDALLDELAERPDLEPSDIAVMAPNIAAYLPLLPAVFGEPGRAQGPLPYHLADVPVARTHPLLDAFGRLLGTPESRLTAPELLDLLELPEIARALGLDGADHETLAQWLRRSRVAWGLDGAHRARFDVPAIDAHTFAWGMDRLLAGYVMGGDGGAAWALPDGELAPVPGVHGPQAALLGALDRLLLELAALQRDAAQPRTASAWATRLEQLLDALFRVDPHERAAVEALSLLRRLIAATALETAESGLDPLLDFRVVREALRERLAASSERQRFLVGGVTFCGMVPQRAIPFRVIAVLGLNDGEFPRGERDAGLDPMQRHRRLGDRDVRSDDRYLFLETVMSAREALHLSYLGEGVRDGRPRNPAAPLAELMGFLDAQAGLSGVAADADEQPVHGDAPRAIRRPWRIRHPLQPFDARYFDLDAPRREDPRLLSFDAGYAGMVAAGARRPFLDALTAPAALPPEAGAEPVPLREVVAYYRDPARQLLARRLNVRLDALEEERLAEQEPLEAGLAAIERVPRRLFLDAVEQGGFQLPEQAPAWLRLTGLLPPGRPGLDVWTATRQDVQVLLDAARALPLFAGETPVPQPQALPAVLAGRRLEGTLERVYAKDDALWLFDVLPGKREAELDFKVRIPFFLEWALLRLMTPPTRPVRACLVCAEAGAWTASLDGWDAVLGAAAAAGDDATVERLLDDLRARVAALLDLWRQAQHQPLPYFPKTSWKVLDEAPDGASRSWLGNGRQRGERDYAPGYARLLAGEHRFEPDGPGYLALRELAGRLRALITLDPEASA
ncbi:exodeoxyribonuclease V subunit gamma [Frateuria defendens]|uniref:exodeoxyribonuclease V subunit gamma n=1 Tax=Frateuria defendens TaxID=2219559 RepID=UPI00066FE2E0|nr:exodeoxyribonuclease V subunit gamma [Frateuria defendens]